MCTQGGPWPGTRTLFKVTRENQPLYLEERPAEVACPWVGLSSPQHPPSQVVYGENAGMNLQFHFIAAAAVVVAVQLSDILGQRGLGRRRIETLLSARSFCPPT